MSARTILTLSNGKGLDLLEPRADDIDFRVLAEHLAKENRFNGATRDLVYSVAEHCVRGCDAILEETGDQELAAYFLLHDAHEAFAKDDTTPKKQALAAIAQEHFGVLAESIMKAFDLLTFRLDIAVHEAAGLPWAPPAKLQPQIKRWDLRMFVTEWRDLMSGQEHPDWDRYKDIPPLREEIEPLEWRQARNDFAVRCTMLLPKVRAKVWP